MLMKEYELYPLVANYLRKRGYRNVWSEITINKWSKIEFDIIAKNTEGTLVIVEVKKNLTTTGIKQALIRTFFGDFVYLAILESSIKWNKKAKELIEVLKKNKIGLIGINYEMKKTRILIRGKRNKPQYKYILEKSLDSLK